MLTKAKYNIVASVVSYILLLIVCIAMFFPRNVGNVLKVSSEPEATYKAEDILETIGCVVDADGTYVIENDDPQMVFSTQNTKTECIRLTVIANVEQNIPFEVFTAYEDSAFSAERWYRGTISQGEQSAVIDVPKGDYAFLRVDINATDVRFECVELFDENPTQVPYDPQYSLLDYIITAVFPLLVAAIVWLLNARYKMVERICKWFSENKFAFLTIVVFFIVAILASILVETLIGMTLADGEFNLNRWLLIAGIALLIVTFVFGYKQLKEKPEKIFLPIVLILGTVMLFGSPIKHICWDLDSHYPWAVQASYPGTTYVTGAYEAIDYTAPQSLISPNVDYEADEEYLSQSEEILVRKTRSEFSLAHLPAGVFIAVTRWFGGDFQAKYNMGRLAYLLVYAFVCYFAIKKLKSGKMILATICLFPTNIFMATNYAYDWWVTAFCILGTAYFVSELQQPQKSISVKDTIIMGLAFALGALPKLVYIVLMGMTLFMKKEWATKKERRRYYIIILTIFAIVLLLFMLRAKTSIGGSGDLRGGAVNPPEQLAGILQNPLGYAKLLFKFLADYLSFNNMKNYISNFAYLGMGSFSFVFAFAMIFTAATDTNGSIKFKIPLYMRALSVLLYIGMAALIASALYLSFTPVGANTINGCQARYIIPLLAPIILLVTGQRFNIIKNKAIYNGVVLGVLSAAVMLDVYSPIIKILI